jgi:threonine/homoserine/homoserine lactone efflux protein
MTFSLITAFLGVATLVIVAPGPDSLLVLRSTIRGGYLGAVATAFGVLTGLTFWAAAAATGLAAMADASQIGYNALHLAGAAYLVWLAVEALRRTPDPQTEIEDRSAAPDRRMRFARMYGTGVLCNVLNPKVGIFFIAVLPGFIPEHQPVGLASAIFGLLFVLETGVWFALVAFLTRRGSGLLRRPSIRRALDRLTAAVMIAFGVRLVMELR